ncbi:MAG TPA: hypothetical protein DDW65_20575 [Firmicutes bacterium]|jgi:hypothetical protein|nr:hypothetical protein [Bacillota bacterium]
MPNKEAFTKLEPLCYLILLMDSLGIEVSSAKIAEVWDKLQPEELSTELIELLVFFWKRSAKPKQFSSLSYIDTPSASACPCTCPDTHTKLETEKAIQSPPESHNEVKRIRSREVEAKPELTAETEQVQGTLEVEEKAAVKKESANQAVISLRDSIEQEQSEAKLPESTPAPTTAVISSEDTGLSGRYVYGIIFGSDELQTTGIDNSPVYTIFCRDIGALVHACAPNPYESTDRAQVEKWLRQHQDVLDQAFKLTSSVVPMTFDMIIDGSSAANPDDVLQDWLQERYSPIKSLLEQLSGRAEYGIKINCSIETLTEKVTQENPEIIELSNRIATMNKGTAYLFKSELAQKIRKAVEEECKLLAKKIIAEVRPLVSDLKENKLDSEISNNQKPILNMAILAEADKIEVIGAFLESLQTKSQYTVVFTGPWPAYSFVKDLE